MKIVNYVSEYKNEGTDDCDLIAVTDDLLKHIFHYHLQQNTFKLSS